MHQDLPWFAQKITHLEYVCIMFALFIPHCSYCSLTTDDYALPHFMPRVSYFTLTVRSRIIPSNQLVSMEFRQNAWLFLYGKVAVAGPLHVWGFLLNLCNFLVQETILWIESIFKPPFICQTPKVPLFTPQKKKNDQMATFRPFVWTQSAPQFARAPPNIRWASGSHPPPPSC